MRQNTESDESILLNVRYDYEANILSHRDIEVKESGERINLSIKENYHMIGPIKPIYSRIPSIRSSLISSYFH